MIVLFLGACHATYFSITGVEAKDLTNWMTEHRGAVLKNIGTPFQSLQNQPEKKASGRVKPLEEAFDWERYPSQKVTATGYTAGAESTGKSPGHPQYGITYSGVKVKRDLYSTVAADPSVFPIGTILFIPNYGYGLSPIPAQKLKAAALTSTLTPSRTSITIGAKKHLRSTLLKKGTAQ